MESLAWISEGEKKDSTMYRLIAVRQANNAR